MAKGFSFLVLGALLVTLLSTTNALVVVNELSTDIVVFVPPICQPCTCPTIYCIRAPCPQPDCFCTAVCNYVPGVTVKSKIKVTISVAKELFPLQYVTVEINAVAYVVAKADLAKININAIIVITKQTCGKDKTGIRAEVYTDPKVRGSKFICLMKGERYGTY